MTNVRFANKKEFDNILGINVYIVIYLVCFCFLLSMDKRKDEKKH